VKQNPERVSGLLNCFSKSEADYYEVRRNVHLVTEDFERAAAFVYLNRFCFNGLYRTNQAGQFNVPYGGHKAGALPDLATLLSCSYSLSKAEIVNCDFEDTLAEAEAGDFVYIDPPFSVRSRRVFKEYDSSLFGLKAILRLKKCLHDLEEKGVSFVLSYAASPEADFLSSGLSVAHVDVRRTIASFAKNRSIAREVIATYRAPAMNFEIGGNKI
jgi:DNA adenine methylase